MSTTERHPFACGCGWATDSLVALILHHRAKHDDKVRYVNLRGEPMGEMKKETP